MIKEKEPGKQFKGTAEERFYFYHDPTITEPAPYGLAKPCQVGWQGPMNLEDDDGTPRPRMYNGERHEYVAVYLYRTRVGTIPEGWLVLHLCDNARCLELTHLERGTKSKNMGPDKVRAGTSSRRLTDTEVRRMWTILKGGGIQSDAAEELGVGQKTVSNIYRGVEYGELRTAEDIEHYEATRRATHKTHISPKRKFTTPQVLEIKALAYVGVQKTKIGRWFGVSDSTIHDILKGKFYKEINLPSKPRLKFLAKFLNLHDLKERVISMNEKTTTLTAAQMRGILALATPFNLAKSDFLGWLASGYKVPEAEIQAVLRRPVEVL